MKATKDGVTVGIALEPFDGETSTTTAEILRGSTSEMVKTGKILVFVNLGYSKLDANSNLETGFPSGNAWSVDQQSGKVNVSFYGNINLNGNYILDVGKITGYLGKWSVDEEGNISARKITAKEVETEKLCVGGICVTKEEFQRVFGAENTSSTETQNISPENVNTSTTTATSTSP